MTAIQGAVGLPLIWVGVYTDWGRPWGLFVGIVLANVLGRYLRIRLDLAPPLDPPLSAWKRPLTAWKRWWSGPHAGPAKDGRQGRPQGGPLIP